METGNKTSNMDMENKCGQMRQFIRGSTEMVKNMEKEYFNGKMIALITDNSLKIIFMALANTAGKTEEFMRDNG